MQLPAQLPLINVPIPAVPMMFFTKIQKIMNFQVVDTAVWIENALSFTLIEDAPLTDKMDELDYGS